VSIDRAWHLPLGIVIGVVVARIASAVPARALIFLLVVAVGAVAMRFIIERILEARAPVGDRFTALTRSPSRCSHCGARRSPQVRMVAGLNAYICELCLRRGVELLDAPEDITRFL
jgi:peptidoglycan/LPS O-acetylase OafA/YrhL